MDIVAPHTFFHTPILFPVLGEMRFSHCVRIPCGCRKCYGTGVESFATAKDIAEHKPSNDPCGDDGPAWSGKRTCPRCDGSGVVDGADDIVLGNTTATDPIREIVPEFDYRIGAN